ncbi:hypothetical protein LEP1GSC058_1951 [Leptospira fainei serovar Hurstbridge str. BUT 6]|uniref:Uncharacterized protein n=1 Tax=Leptospira fainei serovar Hurstbridge str. BUT 6 TaxID=1193011 RepID=S3V3U1_9LEPT|nr:hypothetical protein LEP1GSC058_1951 [Leptospira fainei serovar Hurstbridge str. BUT 6]
MYMITLLSILIAISPIELGQHRENFLRDPDFQTVYYASSL